MTIELMICPCPWCKKTPHLYMPIGNYNLYGTWMWYIVCQCQECTVKPISKYVCIRKNQRKSILYISKKIKILVDNWNTGNPIPAFEKKVLVIKDMMAEIEKQFELDDICEQRLREITQS